MNESGRGKDVQQEKAPEVDSGGIPFRDPQKMLTVGSEERTRALEEYQQILPMVGYEGQIRWTVFGVFLLAETVILGILGTDIPGLLETDLGRWALKIGGIIGAALCPLWLLAFRFYTKYFSLRIAQARRLEEGLGFGIFQEGLAFDGGTKILGVEPLTRREKWISGSGIATVIAVVLFALNVALVFVGCWWP